jgi:hypothetical protein
MAMQTRFARISTLNAAYVLPCIIVAIAACSASDDRSRGDERLQSSAAAVSFTIPAGGIVSTSANKCLTAQVPAGGSPDGAPVVISDCNGSLAQQWSFTPQGEIRVLDRCLDLAVADEVDTATNGAVATLSYCKSGVYDKNTNKYVRPLQVWSIAPSGAVTTAGMCLDVKDWGTANGTTVEVWACAGSANQQWQVQSPPVPISTLYQTCLNPVSDSAGAHVQVSACMGAAPWEVLPTGEIKSPSGLCLDVPNWNTANGTPMQLWYCDGQQAQIWSITGDGALTALGKCLEATGTPPGSLVQIDDCNGNLRESWGIGDDAPETAPPGSNKLRPIAATASNSYPGAPPALAIDGDVTTAWNSGDYSPQWIELDLGRPIPIEEIRLLTAQSPAGAVTFTVSVGDDHASMRTATTQQLSLQDNQWIDLAGPWAPDSTNAGGQTVHTMGNVRYVRISTTSSPSWVAWKEIEVYGSVKYFGYYGPWGNPPSANLATVATRTDITDSATIAQEVATLDSAITAQVNAGKKVMVTPYDLFYSPSPQLTLQPDYVARIQNVLVPALQTHRNDVVALYVVDEPYTTWDNVQPGDVQRVADALHANLWNTPIAVALNVGELATLANADSNTVKAAIGMFDWVGFDCYGPWSNCGGQPMDTYVQMLRPLLTDAQRMIAYPWAQAPFPDAWSGTGLSSQGIIVDTNLDQWTQEIASDPKYVLVAPFLWTEYPDGDMKLGARFMKWVRERLFQLENTFLPMLPNQIFPTSISSSSDPSPGNPDLTKAKDPLDFGAIDRDGETYWTSGGYAPAWIQANFIAPTRVSGATVETFQSPAGQTHHDVYGLTATGWVQLSSYDGLTSDRTQLDWSWGAGVDVTALKIETTSSPSWVGWREIAFY